MAKELGVRPNTRGVRVYRGRELLGKRLAKRGLDVNAGALSLVLAGSISLRFNESLIASTCSSAVAASTHACDTIGSRLPRTTSAGIAIRGNLSSIRSPTMSRKVASVRRRPNRQ